MRSRNPVWHEDTFHRHIAELAEIEAGNTVMDLGCGRGATLPYVLKGVGPRGRVVALDRDAAALSAVETRFADAIAEGRLQLECANFGADNRRRKGVQFDVVICQNVLECLHDRQRLIKDVRRLLRPRGRFLVGHHDFDGVILNSKDRDLTRRIVHGFADHKQAWQDVADGQMGRQLPGMFAKYSFESIDTQTMLFVDHSMHRESYAHAYLSWVTSLAPQLGIDAATLQEWRTGLEALQAAGKFYFAIPWAYVLARK